MGSSKVDPDLYEALIDAYRKSGYDVHDMRPPKGSYSQARDFDNTVGWHQSGRVNGRVSDPQNIKNYDIIVGEDGRSVAVHRWPDQRRGAVWQANASAGPQMSHAAGVGESPNEKAEIALRMAYDHFNKSLPGVKHKTHGELYVDDERYSRDGRTMEEASYLRNFRNSQPSAQIASADGSGMPRGMMSAPDNSWNSAQVNRSGITMTGDELPAAQESSVKSSLQWADPTEISSGFDMTGGIQGLMSQPKSTKIATDDGAAWKANLMAPKPAPRGLLGGMPSTLGGSRSAMTGNSPAAASLPSADSSAEPFDRVPPAGERTRGLMQNSAASAQPMPPTNTPFAPSPSGVYDPPRNAMQQPAQQPASEQSAPQQTVLDKSQPANSTQPKGQGPGGPAAPEQPGMQILQAQPEAPKPPPTSGTMPMVGAAGQTDWSQVQAQPNIMHAAKETTPSEMVTGSLPETQKSTMPQAPAGLETQPQFQNLPEIDTKQKMAKMLVTTPTWGWNNGVFGVNWASGGFSGFGS